MYASLFGDSLEKWRDLANKSDPNDTSIMQGFKEHVLEPSIETFLKSSEGMRPEAQRWMLSRADTMREEMTKTMIADMGTRAGKAVHKNLGDMERIWSNTVALNPEKLPLAVDTIKADIAEQVRHSAYLKPADAARLELELVPAMTKSVARAAAFGMARSNPEGLATAIAQGKFEGYLDAEDQARATNLAREALTHKRTNDEYEYRLKQRGEHETATVAKDEYVTAALNGKSMGNYANDPRLTKFPEVKENLRTLQHTLSIQARDRSENTPHPTEWRNLIDQLHETAEKDPNNISDKPIYDLLRQNKLSKSEFASALGIYHSIDRPLEKQINTYIKRTEAFALASIEANIMKKVSPDDYADAVNRFELEGRQKIAEARAAKQDITPLITPTSEDFVFSMERFKNMLPDAGETLKIEADKVRGKGPTTVGKLGGPPAVAPREFKNEAEVKAAKLPNGTRVIVNGRPAIWNN